MLEWGHKSEGAVGVSRDGSAVARVCAAAVRERADVDVDGTAWSFYKQRGELLAEREDAPQPAMRASRPSKLRHLGGRRRRLDSSTRCSCCGSRSSCGDAPLRRRRATAVAERGRIRTSWNQRVPGAASGHGGTEYEHIETDVHHNPNAHHREIWLRDPDGYLVVLAEPYDERS